MNPTALRAALVVLVCLFTCLSAGVVAMRSLRPLGRHPAVRIGALASGDLLLYHGRGMLGEAMSAGLRVLGGCEYNHAGVVYVDRRCGVPYAWEMKVRRGAQLTPLRASVLRYSGSVVVRRLGCAHRDRCGHAEALERFVREAYGRKFGYEVLWCYGLARRLPELALPASVTATGRDFCFSLVAATYQDMGVLDFGATDRDWRHVLPCDFTPRGEGDLPLAGSHSFGPEHRLDASFPHSE